MVFYQSLFLWEIISKPQFVSFSLFVPLEDFFSFLVQYLHIEKGRPDRGSTASSTLRARGRIEMGFVFVG